VCMTTTDKSMDDDAISIHIGTVVGPSRPPSDRPSDVSPSPSTSVCGFGGFGGFWYCFIMIRSYDRASRCTIEDDLVGIEDGLQMSNVSS